jgi:hypothetical protein
MSPEGAVCHHVTQEWGESITLGVSLITQEGRGSLLFLYLAEMAAFFWDETCNLVNYVFKPTHVFHYNASKIF